MVIVLGALQEALAAFSNPMEALKMVFGVRSIRVFSKFSLDPYYEPLPWFMIQLEVRVKWQIYLSRDSHQELYILYKVTVFKCFIEFYTY